MADQSKDHEMEGTETTAPAGAVDKGKGKAAQVPDAMEESADDSSSGEESGAENEAGDVEPEDEDNMEEIDTSNIIPSGRRTRGKNIDFKKAAEELPDDDEDDDEDFNDPDDAMEE